MSDTTSDTVNRLRDTLTVFRTTVQAVQAANDAGREPSNDEYWARDDAGVEVAHVADKLMHELDNGRIPLVPAQQDERDQDQRGEGQAHPDTTHPDTAAVIRWLDQDDRRTESARYWAGKDADKLNYPLMRGEITAALRRSHAVASSMPLGLAHRKPPETTDSINWQEIGDHLLNT